MVTAKFRFPVVAPRVVMPINRPRSVKQAASRGAMGNGCGGLDIARPVQLTKARNEPFREGVLETAR